VESTGHLSAATLELARACAASERGDCGAALVQTASDRRARALLAQELHALPLSWDQLHQCPLWMAWPAASRDALCALAGAGWLRLSLRGCIDGRQLAPVAGLVGAEALGVILKTFSPLAPEALASAPKPLLPPPQSIAGYVVAWGRALMLWSCPQDCREALAGHFSWGPSLALVQSIGSHAEWSQAALEHARSTAEAALAGMPEQASQNIQMTGSP